MVRARYWEKPKDNENVNMFMQEKWQSCRKENEEDKPELNDSLN
jgi:hypothetical protein